MSSKAPAWVKYWKNDLMDKLLYAMFLYLSQLLMSFLRENRDDFLDGDDDGKDLEDLDFQELNKIGENWAAGGTGDVDEGMAENAFDAAAS